MGVEAEKMRIFVADDEQWYAEGMLDFLEGECGHKVHFEREMNASRALELIRRGVFDLLILDMMMDLGEALQAEWDNDKIPWLKQYLPTRADRKTPGILAGLVVVKKIREEDHSDLPIIFLAVGAAAVKEYGPVLTDLDCIVVDKITLKLSDLGAIIEGISPRECCPDCEAEE